MAYNIKNFRKATKGNEFIKTLMYQKFRTARTQLSLANRPALAKSMKPSSIQWNSAQYSSNARFHHLAEHKRKFNAVYITNVGVRNFAEATQQVPEETNFAEATQQVPEETNFAEATQQVPEETNFAEATQELPEETENFTHLENITDVNDTDRFEKEKERLKRKGVMKDIKIKIPEGVIFSKLVE